MKHKTITAHFNIQKILLPLTFTVSALTLCSSLRGQVSTPVDNLIPPAPESAALAKYIQIPVGHYTGVPEISIPLFSVDEGDISVPLSLSYHASGIKVEEIAERTGMGWSLNAGGTIMRTVVGEADESWRGYLITTAGFSKDEIQNGTDVTTKYNTWRGLMGCADAEPDIFGFNFNGYVGQFGFDWNTGLSYNILVSSSSKMTIQPLDSLGNPWTKGQYFPQPKIFGFKITTADGMVYYFQCLEKTYKRVLHAQEPPSENCRWDVGSTGYPSPVVSSWHLTKIISPYGNEIYFNYTDYDLEYRSIVSELKHRYSGAPANFSDIVRRDTAKTKTLGKYLSSVTTLSGNTIVEFIPSVISRTDLPLRNNGSPNSLYSLGEVRINSKNVDGTYKLIQDFKLYNSYRIGRLTLDSLQEYSTDPQLTSPKPPYRFTYNTNVTLPSFGGSRLMYSCKQDHQGFLNGNTYNSLIPPYSDPYSGNCGWVNNVWVCDGLYLPGANRQTSADSTKAGILTQIQYPAGGTTQFDYEPHYYGAIGNSLLPSSKMAGGVRIQRITDNDGKSGKNIIRKFKYEMPDGKSSGVIAMEPIYEYEVSVTHYPGGGNPFAWIYNNVIDWNMCNTPAQPEPIEWQTRSASSQIPLGMTQGNHIGYRNVTELHGENGEDGKSELSFTSFFDYNDDYSKAFNQPFPPPVTYDYKRGLLTFKNDYRQDGFLEKHLESEYALTGFDLPGFKVGEQFPGSGRPCVNMFRTAWHSYVFGRTAPILSREFLFENGQSFITEHRFEYDNALQFLLKQKTKTSNGSEIINELSYPLQYTFTGPSTSVVYKLQQRHIFSPVIEEIVKEKNGASEQVIGATYTEFKEFAENNNKIYPFKVYKFNSTFPETDFQSSTSVINGGGRDSRYYREVITHDKYSNLGKPQQITAPGGVVNSYIWGYKGFLPVAKITNAIFSRCAFANFEDADKGNWSYDDMASNYSTDSRTGKRSFKGNLVVINNVPPGQYVVSLWAKAQNPSYIDMNQDRKTITNDEWSHFEWEFSVSSPEGGPVTIETSYEDLVLIDDIRLLPKEAQMETFTYEHGIGLSTVTDANHKTVFYEYDNYGRLKNVRDSEGNIIKNYRYQYSE